MLQHTNLFESIVNPFFTKADVAGFIHAFEQLDGANVRRSIAEVDRYVADIHAFLVKHFKLNVSRWEHQDSLWDAFWIRDNQPTHAARWHVGAHIVFAASVFGQITAQYSECAPEIIAMLHAAAGLAQCVSMLTSWIRGLTPGGRNFLVMGGLMQLLSDLMIWMDPRMLPDLLPLHQRRLQHFVNNLLLSGKLDSSVWAAPNATRDELITGQSEFMALWGHYVVFTLMFVNRLTPNNIWHNILLVPLTCTAVSTGFYEYYTEALDLPANPLNAAYHALDGATLRVAVTATNPAHAVVQRGSNLLLMLTAGYANMLSFPFDVDDLAVTEGKRPLPPVPAETFHADWRHAHTNPNELLLNNTVLTWVDSMFNVTRGYLRHNDVTEQCLQWIERHLEMDSPIFKTLFSQLDHAVHEGRRWRQVLGLYRAVKPSIQAFLHYAQHHALRPAWEVVYADVVFDPALMQMTQGEFRSTVEEVDDKLTQLLKTLFFKSHSSEIGRGMYAREHLVNYNFVTRSEQAGFYDIRSSRPQRNFTVADVPYVPPRTPQPFHTLTRDQEQRLFPRVPSRVRARPPPHGTQTPPPNATQTPPNNQTRNATEGNTTTAPPPPPYTAGNATGGDASADEGASSDTAEEEWDLPVGTVHEQLPYFEDSMLTVREQNAQTCRDAPRKRKAIWKAQTARGAIASLMFGVPVGRIWYPSIFSTFLRVSLTIAGSVGASFIYHSILGTFEPSPACVRMFKMNQTEIEEEWNYHLKRYARALSERSAEFARVAWPPSDTYENIDGDALIV